MIDKIDGVKMIRKSANIIENCNKEKCGECLFYDKCKSIIEIGVDFIASIQEQTKRF
ncbi:hypothetical protein R83H12_01571 [Fibrobacteria bacterium R8-3-H12]